MGSRTLVISDVDDTLAPPFKPVPAPLAHALTRMVAGGTVLFLVSGQSVTNIERRVVRAFPRHLRRHILVGHCHGAEVYGYNGAGRRITAPLFSVRENAVVDGVFRQVLEAVTSVLGDHGVTTVAHGDVPDGRSALLDYRGVQVTVDFPASGPAPRDGLAHGALTHDALTSVGLACAGLAQVRTARGVGPAGVLDYLTEGD